MSSFFLISRIEICHGINIHRIPRCLFARYRWTGTCTHIRFRFFRFSGRRENKATRRRATHSLSKRSNAPRQRTRDESVCLFNRLKNHRRGERKKCLLNCCHSSFVLFGKFCQFAHYIAHNNASFSVHTKKNSEANQYIFVRNSIAFFRIIVSIIYI